MRLLFVHPCLSDFGGAQLALSWLMQGLAERGHQIRICAGETTRESKEQLERKKIEVRVPEGKHQPWDAMSRWIAEQSRDADLIVAGNYPATHWVGLRSDSNLPRAIWNCNEPPRALYEGIMSPHFLKSKVDPKFYFPWSIKLRRKKLKPLISLDEQAVHSFGQILSISQQTRKWVGRIYGRNSKVVPLAIADMQLLAQQFPSGPFIILSPAGLEPIKNFPTILDSFRLLLRRHPAAPMNIWITGDGPWRAEAEKKTRALGIGEKVEFLGRITRSELIDCYSQCHAVLFVPLDEPFGLVSCEAGMAGKPVVASNHGGPLETVTHGESGFVVDPLNAREIAESLSLLLSNRELCKKMGEAAQEKMAKEFRYDSYLSKFEKACGDVLENRNEQEFSKSLLNY